MLSKQITESTLNAAETMFYARFDIITASFSFISVAQYNGHTNNKHFYDKSML